MRVLLVSKSKVLYALHRPGHPLPTTPSPAGGLTHSRCSVNAVDEPVCEQVCGPGATDHPFQDGPAVCDCSVSGFMGILYGVLWSRCILACLWVCS